MFAVRHHFLPALSNSVSADSLAPIGGKLRSMGIGEGVRMEDSFVHARASRANRRGLGGAPVVGASSFDRGGRHSERHHEHAPRARALDPSAARAMRCARSRVLYRSVRAPSRGRSSTWSALRLRWKPFLRASLTPIGASRCTIGPSSWSRSTRCSMRGRRLGERRPGPRAHCDRAALRCCRCGARLTAHVPSRAWRSMIRPQRLAHATGSALLGDRPWLPCRCSVRRSPGSSTRRWR